ncbi:MAG: DNA-protecting protein DprA [Ignavibacteriales bacterium]|nr:MAG: DNA-protecting protein DprA [Ignavibacteriales bacterium]
MFGQEIRELSALRLLLSVEGVGSKKIASLVSKFRSPSQILDSSVNSLAASEGIGPLLASRINLAAKGIDVFTQTTQKLIDTCHRKDIGLLTLWDDEYPYLLKNISDPPVILYYKGALLNQEVNPVAIVGTRTPTQYGKNQAERMAVILAQKNITIISGMARGIDSIAHRGALSAGARTLAILGSGVDVIYPPENADLAYEITKNGLLLSEFEPGTKPDGINFPKRNRIIAGMSLGTIVVESGIEGGAIHTAKLALDSGREVFAIPGNIGVKQSEGPNYLIQNSGAKLVTSADDVISELRIEAGEKSISSPPPEIFNLNIFEEKIISLLNKENPVHIDSISKLAGMSTYDALTHLLQLEFKGAVKQLPGKNFITSF